MELVSQMTQIFDDILNSGSVPIIQSPDDIQISDGLYRFRGTTMPIVNDQFWRLEFIPDKSNLYLAPEVINAQSIPCMLPMQSYLYGFAIWILEHLNCKLNDLYPSSLFYCLERCLVSDAKNRILRYV